MSSAFAYWWLALPLLLLPIWWHRQKRQQTKTQILATARFLPATNPQQQRVWQWIDRLLLLVRCLLLVGVMAWLADFAFAWRGDTVLLDTSVDPHWAEQQIKDAGFQQATRLPVCGDKQCRIDTPNIFAWLQAHEREWRSHARLLVLANPANVPMPALMPPFAHTVDVRIPPSPPKPTATAIKQHDITIHSPREQAWRTLFTRYESAGDGTDRYRISSTPNENTELIIWDAPEAPDITWHAPLWWVGDSSSFPTLPAAPTLSTQPVIHYVDSAQGRLWFSPAWPLNEFEGAKALFETWRGLAPQRQPYAAGTQMLTKSNANAITFPSGALFEVLSILLALLFGIERWLSHVKPRN